MELRRVKKPKKIPGFGGFYSMIKNGQIISFRQKTPRRLKVSITKDGYSVVKIGSISGRVHRLLLLTFVGKPPRNKKYALHKDGNPQNNNLSNLYWGSQKDNAADRKKHGQQVRLPGEKNGRAKLNAKKILSIRSMHANGIKKSILAKKFRVTETAINSIVRRKTWNHL